jgi:glycerophosphoryl diester phosphodiesterase
VIAHRGFSGHYPENTILAFRKAIDAGADGIEFDVRATRDRALIVFHDSNLKRLCGIKEKISDKNFAELEKIKVADENIPLLRSVLEFLKKSPLSLIILEMKVRGFEEELLELIWGLELSEKIIVSSIDKRIIGKIRSLDPDLKLAYVLDNRPDKIRTWMALHKKIRLYSLHPFHNRPLSTKLMVSMAKKRGLKIFPWFLRGHKKISRILYMKKLGVDGVMSDYPDEAIKAFRNQ